MDLSLITYVVGFVVLLLVVVLAITTRYKVAGPNEAFIITGRRGKEVRNAETGTVSTDLSGQKVVMGGGVFVLPFVQRRYTLDLSSRRIPVQIRGAVSGQGVKLNLEGVAIVKVGGNVDSIRAAAQRFLTQQQDIQDITDDGTYLSDLGRPEAARIQQQAAIAEAAARRAAEQARIVAEQEIAVAQRELALKKAEIKAETDAATAQASAAGPLAQAERDQAIFAEQEKVAVRQAALTERQLDTQVRKPADAARYKVEQEAEARRNAAIADADARKAASIAAAQADAEKARITGEAEKARRTALAEAEAIEGARRGDAEKARRVAEADATRAEGEAEGAAILARGNAEAEAMEKKATAYGRYNEAAVLQMLVEVLPKVAREVASPMAAIDQLTVLSTDGAAALPRQVADNLTQTLSMLKTTTGLDLGAIVQRFAAGAAQATPQVGGNGTVVPAPAATPPSEG